MDHNLPSVRPPSNCEKASDDNKDDYHVDPPVDLAAGDRARLRTNIPWVDDLVTRVTGKALPGQQPVFRLTPGRAYLLGCLALVVSMTMVQLLLDLAVDHPLLGAVLAPAIVVNLAVLVGRLRAQQVVFGHHAVHLSFCGGNRRVNRIIAEAATVITLSQNPPDYRDDHVKVHHKIRTFTTPDDPDAAFLIRLGFRPGMSRRDLYRLLVKSLLSPRYHFIFTMARLHSSFVSASPVHRALCALWVLVLAVLATKLGSVEFLLGVALPLGPLYHMSALLQFTSEHRWMVGPIVGHDPREYASRNQGRFALAPLPRADLTGTKRVAAWLKWSVCQAGELLFRAAVTVGDLPAHDLHHVVGLVRRRPESWVQAAFERQATIDEGDWLGLSSRQAMGWKQSFDWVFDGLAMTSPTQSEEGEIE